MQSRAWSVVVVFLVLASAMQAQSYADFMLVRNRERAERSLLQVRAGVSGTLAESENEVAGQEDDFAADGFIYYHSKEVSPQDPWIMDAYAGRDGVYFGLKEKVFPGKPTQGRLELFGRAFPFYREGFYSGDDFVPTGRYEGRDYGARLGVSREVDAGMRLEGSTFYKVYDFSRNKDTASDFTEPDNFSAYGARITLEQNTVTLNRRSGLPESGYLWTIAAEREQNDSSKIWGVTGGFQSELPRGIWRGQAHLEMFIPNGASGVFELDVDASLSDEDDRVYNNRAEHPQGNLWADGILGYRMVFGDGFIITPKAALQYVRTLNASGVGSSEDYFYGGGLDLAFGVGGGMAVVARYSFLNNPSRPPVSFNEDLYGEHQFFVGLDMIFGGQ